MYTKITQREKEGEGGGGVRERKGGEREGEWESATSLARFPVRHKCNMTSESYLKLKIRETPLYLASLWQMYVLTAHIPADCFSIQLHFTYLNRKTCIHPSLQQSWNFKAFIPFKLLFCCRKSHWTRRKMPSARRRLPALFSRGLGHRPFDLDVPSNSWIEI